MRKVIITVRIYNECFYYHFLLLVGTYRKKITEPGNISEIFLMWFMWKGPVANTQLPKVYSVWLDNEYDSFQTESRIFWPE